MRLWILLVPLILATLSACEDQRGAEQTQRFAALGDPEVGETAIQQYACVTCHQIPGAVGPDTWLGPNLRQIGSRTYLAGILPNTPDNMIAWLMNPKAIAPDSAMPDLGVTEAHARDIAAYLYRLE